MNQNRDPNGNDFVSEQELEELLAGLDAVGPRSEAPPEDLDQIETATREAWQRQLWIARKRKRRVVTGVVLAAAAAILLAIGIGGRLLAPSDSTQSQPLTLASVERVRGTVMVSSDGALQQATGGDQIPTGAVIESEAESGVVLRLADLGGEIGGPILRLAPSGRLILHDRDDVELTRGSIYIDTGNHDSAPAQGDSSIKITTALGTATDIGTRFMVVVSGDATEVLVRSGRVELSGVSQSATAGAGQRLVLDSDDTLTQSEIPTFGDVWSWTLDLAEPFEVENKTLSEYLAWLSAETGLDYRFEDAQVEAALLGVQLQGAPIENTEIESTIDDYLLGAGLESRIEDGVLWLSEIR